MGKDDDKDLEKILGNYSVKKVEDDPGLIERGFRAVGRGIVYTAKTLYRKTITEYEANPETVGKNYKKAAIAGGVGVLLWFGTGMVLAPVAVIAYAGIKGYHGSADIKAKYFGGPKQLPPPEDPDPLSPAPREGDYEKTKEIRDRQRKK